MRTLFTPWRFAYITEGRPVSDCFLCEAARHPERAESLTVHEGRHHIVLLNRYPYSNGHLMVAPTRHVGSPLDQAPEAQAELWQLTLRCQRILERMYLPAGLNLGMNLGSASGAGVPEHYHFHVVPRWAGDTNFMTVVGETRVVPEDLESVRVKMRTAFSAEDN